MSANCDTERHCARRLLTLLAQTLLYGALKLRFLAYTTLDLRYPEFLYFKLELLVTYHTLSRSSIQRELKKTEFREDPCCVCRSSDLGVDHDAA